MNHNLQPNIIHIYCDGGIRNRQTIQNTASWACVLILNDNYKEISGLLHDSTNNIAELTAPIRGLSILTKPYIPIIIYSDSQYVVNGISKWIYNWIKNDWISSSKQPVKNKELWLQLFEQRNRFENIEFVWVRGHSTTEFNNRADQLCNEELDKYLLKRA